MTTAELLLEYSLFADLILAVGVLMVMMRQRLLRSFPFLAAFIVVSSAADAVATAILFFRRYLFGISVFQAYDIYFYSEWVLSAIQLIFVVLIIYGVFREAMRPLEGLRRAGQVVFRWVGGVSVAVSVGFTLGFHASSGSWIPEVYGQLQQGICVLVLCLLLFVCFSTRYLGLTYRSRTFGVALGLGVWAMADLVESAWVARGAVHSVYSPIYSFMCLSSCVSLLIWGGYLALPEPAPKMVLLPTTSPYFLWNRISEALGDAPGFVAIAGFKPGMLAPAEMAAIAAGSAHIRERELERAIAAEREAEMAESASQSVGFSTMALTGNSVR
ncbi:MAG: hypothetical protein ACP5E5_11740 [Acidobacteriaceae bacterium]